MFNRIYATVFLLILTHSLSAQHKKVYHLSDALVGSIDLVDAERIEEAPNGDVFVSGRYILTDTISASYQPQFIYNLNASTLDYNEEGSGFIIFGMQNFGLAIDSFGNQYTCGSVNGNTFISKSDNNNTILWTKRMGHHVVNDLILKDSIIAIIAQDETTLASHTMFISLIDTAGNLVDAKNFYSGHGFDDGRRVLPASDGYVLVGADNESDSARANVFVVKVDFNLDTLWTQIIRKDSLYHQIGDAVVDDNAHIYITGTINKTGAKDTVYLLKLDEDGTVLFNKSYHDLDTFDLNATALALGANANLFIGFNKIDGIYAFPSIMKLDSLGDVIWTKNIKSDTNSIESIKAMISKDDSLIVLGNYKLYDTAYTPYRNFFTLKLDQDSAHWICDDSTVMTVFNTTYSLSDTVFEEGYIGLYVDYPFTSDVLNLSYTIDSCALPLDTIGITHASIVKTLKFSNPSKGQVFVYGLDYQKGLQFRMVNSLGQAVMHGNSAQIIGNKIDVSNLESGIYLINFYIDDGLLQQDKLIIYK